MKYERKTYDKTASRFFISRKKTTTTSNDERFTFRFFVRTFGMQSTSSARMNWSSDAACTDRFEKALKAFEIISFLDQADLALSLQKKNTRGIGTCVGMRRKLKFIEIMHTIPFSCLSLSALNFIQFK